MPAISKINDQKLLEMYRQGLKRSIMAKRFGVTITAVSKRLRYLSSSLNRPEQIPEKGKVSLVEESDNSLNVHEAFKSEGLTPHLIAKRLKTLINSKDPSTQIRTIQELCKVMGLYRTEDGSKVNSIIMITNIANQFKQQLGNNDND